MTNINESYFEKLYQIEQLKEQLNGEYKYECDCNHLEIRVREFGGGIHYVRQCMDCGRQRGGSLKKEVAEKELNGQDALPFDAEIEEDLRLHNRSISDQIAALREEEKQIKIQSGAYQEFEHDYAVENQKYEEANKNLSDYISGFKDDFGLEKAINALINQTVELNKVKHKKYKETVNRFNNEPELKKWLEDNLSRDFYIYPEVNGFHISERINVRIDFILIPKEHLIANGFDPSPFGVEVKYLKQEDGFTRKSSRALWQTISYMDSVFIINQQQIRLKFSLLFSNLSFHDEVELLRNYGFRFENDRMEWQAMKNVANHARVGTLEINGRKDDFVGWRIFFAGGVYFSSHYKNGESTYRKSNENVINKVRVGNF